MFDITVCGYDIFVYGFGTVGSIWLINRLFTWYSIFKKTKKKQKEVSSRKMSLFQKFKGMKHPFKNKDRICNLSGSEIHELLKSGELLAVDVLEAFQANAINENNRFNFISDIIYEADVSSLMIEPSDSNGLNGLPLAISDSLCVAKYDSTFGLLKESFQPSPQDSVIVQILREAGAIPSIITNISQGDLPVSASNPIIGQTLNSLDIRKSCGGSSGGLAVALATSSCVIGVTNDMHGNIRIPASFCGVYGLKTSSNRISRRRVKTAGPRQNIIKDSIGPMARNIDDLVTLFRSMVSRRTFELDPLCCPVPFNEDLFSSATPLKIGYYVGLGDRNLHPVPAVERAVLMAKKALEKAGHELVEYRLPNIECITDKLFTKITLSDGGQSVKKALKTEPIDRSLRSYLWLLKIPRPVKCLLSSVTGWFCRAGAHWLSGLAGVGSVFGVWQLQNVVDEYRELVLASWETEHLDGLICPVLPIVAPPVNKLGFLVNENPYTVVYNILDYVAGCVPVTKVTEDDIDNLDQSYSTRSRCCHRIAKSQRDSVGLPVGVQCVALPWREETALRIMKNVTDNL